MWCVCALEFYISDPCDGVGSGPAGEVMPSHEARREDGHGCRPLYTVDEVLTAMAVDEDDDTLIVLALVEEDPRLYSAATIVFTIYEY